MPAPDASADGRRAFFVYYRLRPERVPALLQAFAGLRMTIPCRARLMRKAELVEDQGGDGSCGQTWMEVYWLADDAPTDVQALQQAIECCADAAGIVALIDGERHYEAFETCA